MWPAFVPADDITQQKTYDFATVKNAFDSIVQTSQIDFDFCQGGCQQRAHLISMLLYKKFNIEHSKIWLFAPVALHYNDTRTLFVEDKNKLSPFDTVNWNYHVTPAVLVKENEVVNFFVIDPCINKDEPILMDSWFKNIGNSGTGQYSFYHPHRYFFNSLRTKDGNDTPIFDGSFLEYTNPDKDDLILEKGLAVNDAAMAIYRKHIKPLMEAAKEEDKPRLEDLKAIFGNATALDMLLSQNVSAYTDNTTHRYAITHYSNIMQEAKSIFNERLVHWAIFVNGLL